MEELEILFFAAENEVNPLIFPISKTEITIGRNKYKNDIVLVNAEISDVHAKIIINDINDYSIKDLQSETGVFRIINDNIRQRLKPNKEYDLNLNSFFFLGKYKCILKKREKKEENIITLNSSSPKKDDIEVMIPDSMKKLGDSERTEKTNKDLMSELDTSNKNLEIVNKNIEEISKKLEKPKEATQTIQIPKAYNKKFKPKSTLENQKTEEEKDHEKKLAEYNNKITHVISNEESVPFGKIDLKKNAEENLQGTRNVNKIESINSIDFSDSKIIEKKTEIAKEENLKKKIIQKEKPNKNDLNKKLESKNIIENKPLTKNESKKEEDFEIIIDINKNDEEPITKKVENKNQLDNFNEDYFQKPKDKSNTAKKLDFEFLDDKQQIKKKPTKKDDDKIKMLKSESIIKPSKDLEAKSEIKIIEETKKAVESKEESVTQPEMKKEKKIRKKETKEEIVDLENKKQPLKIINEETKTKTPEPMEEEEKIVDQGKNKRPYKKKEKKEPFKTEDQAKFEAELPKLLDSKTLKSTKNKSSQKQTVISKNDDPSPQNVVETSFGKQEKINSQKSINVTPKIKKTPSLKRNPADKKENDIFFEKENKKLLLETEKSKENTPDFGSAQARSNRRKGFNVILSGFKLEDTVVEVLLKMGVKIVEGFDETVDYLIMVKRKNKNSIFIF